jgi:hypothetical protein
MATTCTAGEIALALDQAKALEQAAANLRARLEQAQQLTESLQGAVSAAITLAGNAAGIAYTTRTRLVSLRAELDAAEAAAEPVAIPA